MIYRSAAWLLLIGGVLVYLSYRAGVCLLRDVPQIEMKSARALVSVGIILCILVLLGVAAGAFYMFYTLWFLFL